MALEAMWVIPRKASSGSKIFPRRRSCGGPAIIAEARVPGAGTGRSGCGRLSGRSTIWAIRSPGDRASWKSRIRDIAVPPVDNTWRPHMTLEGLRRDGSYYDRKPEEPKRNANTVPGNIERHVFTETRVAAYRLKIAA